MFQIIDLPLLIVVIPLFLGWILDQLIRDPECSWHPIVLFGNLIRYGEQHLNRGNHRLMKGALLASGLVLSVYLFTTLLICLLNFLPVLNLLFISLCVFFSLSNRTLIEEVKSTFEAVSRSTEEGRAQLSRIVGRDTAQLNDQEIRTAALETLAENLSDGVIAPLFWYLLLGLPGMLAYKMINTLDSMIAYKSERYLLFGRFAAHLDDIANYLPARLTALLMLTVAGCLNKIRFVMHFGPMHASPNSGYPESAMAAILNCRFGGTHLYFGQIVEKPFIGTNERILDDADLKRAVAVNSRTDLAMGLLVLILLTIYYI